MNKLMLCGLVGVSLVLGACGETPPQDAAAGQAVEESQPAVEVMEVDAKTLFADYSANEVKADGTYKGKMLKVTGVIDSIDSGFMDEAMLML